VIVILVVILAFARLKQKISGNHFKNSTGEGPDVSRRVVICANDNFGRPVLPRLNFRCEMVVGPAAIPHITNFNLHILINFRAAFVLVAFLLLLLLFASKQIIEVWLRSPQSIETISHCLNFLFGVRLALLYNCFLVNLKSGIFNIMGCILY